MRIVIYSCSFREDEDNDAEEHDDEMKHDDDDNDTEGVYVKIELLCRNMLEFWPLENKYYSAVIVGMKHLCHTVCHKILYCDGSIELLDLNQEKFRF